MKQTFFSRHAVKINRHLKILAAVRDLLHRSLAKFEVADSVALAVGRWSTFWTVNALPNDGAGLAGRLLEL